jgi:hypothetical protein
MVTAFSDVMTWVEAHPGTAGWAQAIGAILVVIVAIWVPARQRRTARADAERERRLRARSLLILIGPELLELRVDIERALRALSDRETFELQSGFLLENLTVDLPPLIARNIDELYLFGEPAGLTLQQLVSVVLQHGRMRKTAEERAGTRTGESVETLQTSFRPHIELMKRLIDEADEELKPFDISSNP